MSRRTVYFLALIALLVGVQLRAEIVQVKDGYKPFGAPPQRVPFSWDMFAVDIDRCAVSWDPPLTIDGRKVARFRDTGTYFEWDSVYDLASYKTVARAACKYKSAEDTAVRMTCARTTGALQEIYFACP